MSTAPDISLPRFEGPLDLLLELVRKNEIEITDIPIAEITRQYLAYLHQAEELDVELGSEFAYIAALLIHLKSRCLLVSDPEIAVREDDPRQELVRMLLDHAQVREEIRQGAEFLKQQLQIVEATWSRSSIEQYQDAPVSEMPEPNTLNLLEVLRLARQALDAARTYEIVALPDSVTVEQMMHWLADRLANTPGRLEAEQLLAEQSTTQQKAALFLAILEAAKSAHVQLDQQHCFGPVYVERIPHSLRHNCAIT